MHKLSTAFYQQAIIHRLRDVRLFHTVNNKFQVLAKDNTGQNSANRNQSTADIEAAPRQTK